MASLPPRQASQRRPSPEQTTSRQPHPQSTPSTTSPVRTRSEDSQTLFRNTPKEDDAATQPAPEQPTQDSSKDALPSQPPPPPDNDTNPSVQKCWICFSDSTEDTPTTSPWRSPCPCALVAHEECLLDWIADMESPSNSHRPRRGDQPTPLMSNPKIQCPQCKSEIHLSRPRNLVVDAVRALERLGAQLITPGALTVLFGTVYHSSMAWGVHSIYAVFGAEDGFRILRPLILNSVRPPLEWEGVTLRQVGERVLGIAVDHLVHWRLYVGLPLITPLLVLSRTSFADSVLPVLPIVFFATQNHSPQDQLQFAQWPPSASLAFAVLPYLRSAYNMYYRRVWAAREKRWMKEIQPRVGQQGQNEGGAGGDGANPEMDDVAPRDDGNVFEVRIDGGIWEGDEWEFEEEDVEEDEDVENQVPAHDEPPPPMQFWGAGPEGPPRPEELPPEVLQQQQQQLRRPQQELLQGQAQPPPDIADNRPVQQPPNQQNQPHAHHQHAPAPPAAAGAGGERRLSFSPTAIAETVLGALVFPALAGMSGELLKLALPRAWTTPPATTPVTVSSSVTVGKGVRVTAKGLLQEKWGRSLVGGCLFVVLKDAVLLYVRWKMAQMHRRRRVLDYRGEGKKGVGAAR